MELQNELQKIRREVVRRHEFRGCRKWHSKGKGCQRNLLFAGFPPLVAEALTGGFVHHTALREEIDYLRIRAIVFLFDLNDPHQREALDLKKPFTSWNHLSYGMAEVLLNLVQKRPAFLMEVIRHVSELDNE